MQAPGDSKEVTAILAWLVAQEHMTRLQVIGVAVAVLAIVLITV